MISSSKRVTQTSFNKSVLTGFNLGTIQLPFWLVVLPDCQTDIIFVKRFIFKFIDHPLTATQFDLPLPFAKRRRNTIDNERIIELTDSLQSATGSLVSVVRFEINAPGGVRHMHLGLDASNIIVVMVTTMRPDETVRVISFRPASKKERETYIKLTRYNPSVQRTRETRH